MTDNMHIPFVQTGSYPVRSGNRVRPLIDGEPAFRRICQAIEAAHKSVWVTATFMWADFEMPDGRGSALDVLDRAAACGVDVRVIFWRPDAETEGLKRNAFWGSPEHIAELEGRGSGIRIRWDRAHPGYCQHQKSWLIDAGEEGEVAFVGGINLNPHSVVSPGHRGEGQNHDVYVELSGPSTVDVHHNFVQRWNEASERLVEDGRWGIGSETDLPFPERIPPEQGGALVQIQRTIHEDRLADGRSTPGGAAFGIASGERSILDQYRAAIDSARCTIYIENQYITVPEIVNALLGALRRGVEVLCVMPSEPDGLTRYVAETIPAFRENWQALGECERFMLAGLAGIGDGGRRAPVYVHAKLMLIDDIWATVGSANLHSYSLFGNAEMNVAFQCSETVRNIRAELFQEHLAADTSGMDDCASFRLFREVARENSMRFEAGDHDWRGIAFALDPTGYGL